MGIATGLGSRVLTLAAPLLTIPVTLRYLGPDLFGFWMIITSITAMAMFADLGLGNGLLTRLAPAVATRDLAKAKTLISTAYATLGGVALLLLIIIWSTVTALDWESLVGESSGLDPQAVRAIAGISLSAFAVTIPLSLVHRVQYAFQEAWKSNAWQVIAAAFTVAAVYGTAAMDFGYEAIIAAAAFSSPFVMLLNNLFYFGLRNRALMPTVRSSSASAAGPLLKVGIAFFALSALTSISLNVDNLIVAKVADLETVSAYSVTTKLFSLLGLAITLVALPLWPANGEALARGDVQCVRKTTRIMVILSVSAVAAGGLVLILGRNIIASLWLGPGSTIPLALAISLVVWSTMMAVASPLFSVQNSVGLLTYQFAGWGLFTVLSIPLKFYLYSLFGLPGIPLAGAATYLLVLVPTAFLGYRATLRRGVGIGQA